MGYKTFGTEVATSSDVNTLLMRQAVTRVESGSRPTAQNGTMIWETDNLRDHVYNGSTWDALGFPGSLSAYKTVDESVSSSITLQDDNELFISLPANTRWLIEMFLLINAPAGSDMSWSLVGPPMSRLSSLYTSNQGSPTDNDITIKVGAETGGDGSLSMQGGNDIVAVMRSMMVSVGGSSGTATLQWAQAFSRAGALTLRASSFLFARRVE